MRLILTDAERYPFSRDDRARIPTDYELVELSGHAPQDIRAAAPAAAAIFVYHATIDTSVIDSLRDCRIIARCGTGYEKIDVEAAHAAGIEVTYVPDYGSTDVAAHALALILTCARKIVACDRAVRTKAWPTYPELKPLHRLECQVLGLLGFGRIARSLAAKARALGMEVIAHDPAVASVQDARIVGFEELMRSCDVLSIHTPLTSATRRVVDAHVLALMRPGAIVVNTSRGGIVDEQALLDALERGQLSAAGLDVFEQEPLAPDSPLLAQPNVVLTPHSAAYSEQAMGELRTRALDEVLRVLSGSPPRHPVPTPSAAS
jgi:phosphoglycerate dehydrogenase-like enzyme